MVVGEVRRSVQTLRTEHRRERLPRHRDRLAGPPPQRQQRHPDPRHARRADHAAATRDRERAAAHRPGGHDQRRPALRRARSINVQCRVAPPTAEIVVSDDGRGLGARPRRLARPRDHARARGPDRQRDLDVADSVPARHRRCRYVSTRHRRVAVDPEPDSCPHDRTPLTRMTTEPDTLRVLIVDDHELIREGLVGCVRPRGRPPR